MSSELGEYPRQDARLELRFWLRLLACTTMIERRIRRRLRAEFGTTLPRFDVLAQLDRSADGLTMGDLSSRLMVSAGNITGLIERLVREGLVTRMATPGDRRTQRVRLTAAGKRLFDSMTPAHEAWVAESVASLSDEEMREINGLLEKLKTSLQREQAV